MADTSGFDPLSNLRDVHMPDAVSWWPPAPGWWFVALLGTVFLFLIGRWWRQMLRSPLRAARRELGDIEQAFQANKEPLYVAVSLSALLRRVAIVAFPGEAVAGLTGVSWLRFLDRTGATDDFTAGPGRALASVPYQADAHVPALELLDIARRWIAAQKASRGSSL